MPSRANERINFGKIKEIIAPPNLIELQTNSYAEFLQLDLAPTKRKNLGLQAVFKEVFPIESYDGKVVLDYHSYDIGEPKNDWLECLREGILGLGGGSSGGSATTDRHGGHGSSGGDAPGSFKLLHQVRGLDDRELAQLFDDRCDI